MNDGHGSGRNPVKSFFRKLFPDSVIARLKRKFVLINMLIVTLMLAAIFIFVYQMTSTNLKEQSRRLLRIGQEGQPMGPGGEFGPGLPMDGEAPENRPQGSETPDEPAENLEAPEDHPQDAGISDRVRELEVQLPYLHVRVDSSGSILLSEGNLELDEDDLTALIAETSSREKSEGTLKDRNLRYSRQESPISTDITFVDISAESETLQNLLRTFLIIGAAALVGFLFISIFLAHWAIRPVEEAWKEQRQFVSDASHELKTPLTVILSNAEMLKNPSFTPEEKSQFTDNILTESRSMKTLTENLLSLARSDNDTAKDTFERLNLSELAEDAALPFDAVFFEKSLMLETACEPYIFVHASKRQLRECVGILLDNALKYSDPNTTVRLSVEKRQNHAILSVSDVGPEIPSETLKNLFKRFYRATDVREADGSYGLGLSILESYITKAGGKAFASSSGGTNTFGFRLPLA